MKFTWIIISIISGSLLLASCGNDNETEQPEPEEAVAVDEAEEETREHEEVEVEDLETEMAGGPPEQEQEPEEAEEPAALAEEEPRTEEEQAPIAYDDEGRFTVQLFSWKTREFAELRLEEWKNRGYDRAFLSETTQNDTTMYRLRIGRFGNLQMAERMVEDLKQNYDLEPWVDNYRDE